jgi:hypothetical protein
VKKILLLCAVGLLAGCQSEAASNGNADAKVVDGSNEAVEKDIAANLADPVTASGKTVNLGALQVAFDAQCPDTKVLSASCKTTDNAAEFQCDYALKGDNVFSMKQTTITEDGESWKLISIPNHCTKQ